ncbi:MAG TPA: hypothetical protein DCZ23_04970 [Lachnospiraceae bacterium]|nr:hypothetical protein [Lachnospiraceae bacterium]
MDKPKRKIVTAFILMLCLAVAVVAVYYFISRRTGEEAEDMAEPGSEIEKLIQKDLDTKYPATPSEVVKLYWRFNKCMYNTDMSDENFEQLLKQLRKLYDEEFLADKENSWENMLKNFKKDRDEYMSRKRIIAMYTIEPSSSAVYGKLDSGKCVTIMCNVMLKEKAKRINIVEKFMCRCDKDNNWKILGWDEVNSEDSGSEDNSAKK